MTIPQLTTMSSYSLLQSVLSIPDYVQRAKKLGYKQIGLTDLDNLFGSIEFYQACLKEQLHPLLGGFFSYESPETKNEYEIYLFAKNNQGFQELIQLSNQRNLFQSSFFDLDSHPNLVAILPEENEIRELYEKDQFEEAERKIGNLYELFSGGFYYGVAYQKMPNEHLKRWYEGQGVFPIGYHAVVAPDEAAQFSVSVIHHIKNRTRLGSLEEEQKKARAFGYLIEAEILEQWFEEKIPLALKNAQQLAKECQVTIEFGQPRLPHYPLNNGEHATEFLRRLCFEKLPKRVAQSDEEYVERLNYELSVIEKMGFSDYFLIVWDVMNYMHKQQMTTGAGRGSAAGSLVAYVLSITDVDPITYDLLFERFLNPERFSLPDIDIDIPDNRREEVLLYIQEKYSKNRVVQIGTFGTLAAKAVIRDVGSVFGFSQSEMNQWSKAIPNTPGLTLEKAYGRSKNLQKLVNESKKNQRVFQVAQTIEGLPKNTSTHAAGIIISDEDLLKKIPLQEGTKEMYRTQWTMHDLEAVGLLKMDFLGLKNLSILDRTFQGVRQLGGNLTQKEIPLDDEATFLLFKKGLTQGIFQFDSLGIRRVLQKMEPENLEDIAAVNALYRPGPMENIDLFVRRKKGNAPIKYPDPSLEMILQPTYGVIVYQEQIMQIASKMAGFNLGEADLLRRAISKKNQKDLEKERTRFVKGAIEKGYDHLQANEVYDYIEHFANYGFNRSHAFAYSLISYQMGYLKAHYPAPFFQALLQSVSRNSEKTKIYIYDAKKMNVTVLPPDLNQSNYSYRLVSDKEIRFGLGAIKKTHPEWLRTVLKERSENGVFQTLEDFLIRLYKIDPKWLKEDYFIPMIASGAFDCFSENRKQLSVQLSEKIKNIRISGGNLELMNVMALKPTTIEDYTLSERIELEESYLGLNFSGDSVQSLRKKAPLIRWVDIIDAVPNEIVHLSVVVKQIREIQTKNGEKMAFIQVADETGELSLTVFPELYRSKRGVFHPQQLLVVEGKVNQRGTNGEMQVIVRKLYSKKEWEDSNQQVTCYIKVTEEVESSGGLLLLAKEIKKYPGTIPVILYFETTNEKRLLEKRNWITKVKELDEKIKNIFGNENVIFK